MKSDDNGSIVLLRELESILREYSALLGIGNAQESADYLQGTVNTSTELIGQCKSIIERIRSRGETEAK